MSSTLTYNNIDWQKVQSTIDNHFSGVTYTSSITNPKPPIYEDKDIVVINNDETELLRIENKSILELMDSLEYLLKCTMDENIRDEKKIAEAYSKLMKSLLELSLKRGLVDSPIYEFIKKLPLDELEKLVGDKAELQEFLKECLARKAVYERHKSNEKDGGYILPNGSIAQEMKEVWDISTRGNEYKYWTSTGTNTSTPLIDNNGNVI